MTEHVSMCAHTHVHAHTHTGYVKDGVILLNLTLIRFPLPVSPGASGMQPRDPGRPWRGTLASGHKPR